MTFDTNVLIAYLAGEPDVVKTIVQWRKEGRALFLPTVTESELLSFARWTSHEQQSTERFLEENFTSIPFDRAVARIAANIRREYKVKFPDAAIAATAFFTRTPLVTRNLRDFRKITSMNVFPL